jgi:Tol biopolymer transport system component
MTAEQRFERELPDILADLYPVSAPDYREDLVQKIAATRQRPAWALPERWIPMTAIALGRPVRQVPWRTIGLAALLLLAIVAVALIAGSQPRQLPAPFGPAANGDLVLSEGGDLFLVDSTTGTKSLAVGGPAADFEPIFSRDGTRIAFFREVDGVRSLWLADDRGGGLHPLSTDGLVDFSQIEWSPDGKSILLTASVVGKSAPAIVPTDGSPPHVIEIDMPAESPIWHTNGQEILFRGVMPTGFGLFAIRSDGTGLRTIVRATGVNEWDALFYAPSPDGSKIAYQWRDGDGTQKLYVVPATGGTRQAITAVESVGGSWSPDGTWIYFLGEDGVYVVRADGSAPERRMTTTSSPGGAAARWAPDGRGLLVVANGHADQLVFDPLGGDGVLAPWSSLSLPDWQRLAPTP